MQIQITGREYYALLRSSLFVFAMRCFAHLNPGTPFLPNWHLELIAARLNDVFTGITRRLIVNIPPRYLKSLLGSIALPAFILGHDPSAQIICVSYAQEFSEKLARDCRSVMTSAWYKTTFSTRLSSQRQSVQELTTTRGGSRLATSVGGILTGRGAGAIIIDDPAKPDEAMSEVLRKGLHEWYAGTLLSRLNDKRTGRIVIISQRLHEDDLVGHVVGLDNWVLLRLPAIAEQDEEHEFESISGRQRVTRKTGEALHPKREPLEVLEKIRRTSGEWVFAAQYQQSPMPLSGGMVKKEWLKSYDPENLPAQFEQVLQSWDTANKPNELNDFSVCTTWGIFDRRIYLLHMLRKRLDYPGLKRAVREQAELHRASVVLIEDRASGTQLIQELIDEGFHAVTRYVPEGDKQMRLYAQTAMIENGFFYLPREAPWLADYVHELITFPSSKFDDQVDSTSQALDWIKCQHRESWFSLYVEKDLTRDGYIAGLSAQKIAAEHDIPLERVKRWLAELQRNPPQSGLSALEALKEQLRKFCPACGKEILGEYVLVQGIPRHPGCI